MTTKDRVVSRREFARATAGLTAAAAGLAAARLPVPAPPRLPAPAPPRPCVLDGGPLHGVLRDLVGDRLYFPFLGPQPAAGPALEFSPVFSQGEYRATGRTDAAGRRVFACVTPARDLAPGGLRAVWRPE